MSFESVPTVPARLQPQVETYLFNYGKDLDNRVKKFKWVCGEGKVITYRVTFDST
ncbi:hypothetical protein [Parashewanella spongiae]|uniref:hypothetical protein n=1 Tax=Parashewanella spongiae TaxID=342950 RepID=UPI001404504A|nr:hypothetical protein [Parashewanella spongiae]